MKKNISCIVIALAIASLCLAQQMQPIKENAAEKNNNSWTNKNSVAVRKFDSRIIPSPDGNYFYFVSRQGDLEKDVNIFKLEVFSTKEVLSALDKGKINNISYVKPVRIVTVSTAANFPGIYASFPYTWTDDSKSILFSGREADHTIDSGYTVKLYLYNVVSGSLKMIKSTEFNYPIIEGQDIVSYNKDASRIIFSIQKSIREKESLYNTYPEIVVNETNAYLLLGDGCKSNSVKKYYSYSNDKIVEITEYDPQKDSLSTVNRLKNIKEPLLPDGLKVIIREDINTAPVVVASKGKKEVYLTEPDPALENVYIAPTKTIKWQVPDGRIFNGGLTLPAIYDKQKPLPLVIQNGGFDSTSFQPDGSTSPGALQTLVANGFAVLQIGLSLYDIKDKYGETLYTKHLNREGPDFVEKIDAVVKMLADSGLIDQNRVGLIGFSRGGYEVLCAITNPGKVKPAAAIDIDGFTGSYSNYLLDCIGSTSARSMYENSYNGSFWENKSEWLKLEPTFNITKVKTPLLYAAHTWGYSTSGRDMLYKSADLLSTFPMNKKPLEFLLYPTGMHGLVRPMERYATFNSTLDWMNFWLKGVEDTDPAKAEKYKRWREFRKMQDAVVKVD